MNEKEEYRIELYKSLRSKVRLYVEKVPALWLQKFLLAGAMIAFLVNNQTFLGTSNIKLLIAAVLAIPILAMFLDVKILEYGFHARAISGFIKNNFTESEILGKWESYLWGDEDSQDALHLVKIRSNCNHLTNCWINCPLGNCN